MGVALAQDLQTIANTLINEMCGRSRFVGPFVGAFDACREPIFAFGDTDGRDPMSRTRMPPRVLALICTAALCACLMPTARGFSLGSPICEVNGLPLVEMSPTLANPPPTGWSLRHPTRYTPGRILEISLVNGDPLRRARGVLIWSKSGPNTGSGSFAVPGNERWQHVPAPAECGTWALTHTDAVPKTQAELRFLWAGSEAAGVILRAFVIEDCATPSGCRDQQALTPISFMAPILFGDGFEAEPLPPSSPFLQRE
jgi:hypothetical protein